MQQLWKKGSHGANSPKSYNTMNLAQHLKSDHKALYIEYEEKCREKETEVEEKSAMKQLSLEESK